MGVVIDNSATIATHAATAPRIFFVWRKKDHSESAKGLVCWGVEWPGGHASTRPNGSNASEITNWDSVNDIVDFLRRDGDMELRYLGPLVCDGCLSIYGDVFPTIHSVEGARSSDVSAELTG